MVLMPLVPSRGMRSLFDDDVVGLDFSCERTRVRREEGLRS